MTLWISKRQFFKTVSFFQRKISAAGCLVCLGAVLSCTEPATCFVDGIDANQGCAETELAGDTLTISVTDTRYSNVEVTLPPSVLHLDADLESVVEAIIVGDARSINIENRYAAVENGVRPSYGIASNNLTHLTVLHTSMLTRGSVDAIISADTESIALTMPTATLSLGFSGQPLLAPGLDIPESADLRLLNFRMSTEVYPPTSETLAFVWALIERSNIVPLRIDVETSEDVSLEDWQAAFDSELVEVF